MNRIVRLLIPVALIATVFYSCQKDDITPILPPAGDYLLPLIATTDIHGHIVNTSSDTVHYRLAYIADKVKDIRGHGGAYNKKRLLLLDGGDLYQGATLSNIQQGRPIYISMDMMEYDAVALGNHDFDWGLENMVDPDATLLDYEYHGRSCRNQVPVVCANLYQHGSRVSCTKDYIIVEKTASNPRGGSVTVKIGIIGFADDYSLSIISSQFSDKGYSIQANYTIANSLASELESSGQCDATILLTHGAADKAAQHLGDTTAFDLVLGGHTHLTISGQTDWGLPYLQAGKKSEVYAYAELQFHVDNHGNISFTSVNDQQTFAVDATRDLHTFPGQNAQDLDQDILTLSDEAISNSSEQLGKVIGHINVNASNYFIDGSGQRATVMGNWMCDITRRIGQADVAFLNRTSIRTNFSLNGHPTRDITISNVYEMFPFGNETYVFRITYTELLQLFEYSMTGGGKILLTHMTGIDCHFTGTERTSSSGNTYYEYSVHSLSKDGTTIYQEGEWTSDWSSRTLTVATCSYVATTDREDRNTHLHNPFVEWCKTSRLTSNNLIDNENAIRVLTSEAEASGGLLSIDTIPHFILRAE